MPDYSDSLILTWHLAAVEAGAAAHATIKPGHLFVALCKVCDLPLGEMAGAADDAGLRDRLPTMEAEIGELRQTFASVGLDVKRFRRQLRAVLGSEGEQPADGVMHRTPEARGLFDRAESLCLAAGAQRLRPLHLLWALCEMHGEPWSGLLEEMHIEQGVLLAAVAAKAQSRDAAGAVSAGAGNQGQERLPAGQPPPRSGPSTPLLNRFGRDLTRLAAEGRLTPVIGRRDEILRLGQVLLQHIRNNAILVGEAGVGKTCIVEGLAQRMAGANASEQFRRKRIVEIPVGALVAGTKYRGEFEERLQGILAEASGDPDTILFIDEIHTLVGAGSAGEGSMDAAAIMKPALARGEIRCIGATTTREYRRYIEKDSALQRRFQVIWVEEPAREEAIAILQGLRPSLQQHHGFPVADDAITAAVELSIRYAPDLRLPDKAIDLIDESCARARLRTFSGLTAPAGIGGADVAQVVADRYRVPLENLTEDEAARLLRMEEALRQRVKGQTEAVSAVSDAVRAARAGLKPPHRPQGVFLFLGPTGTGKTELAKALAEFLFGSEERLIRLDMSEYAERHTVSKLIGAPPGYVGHEEEGQLTSAIRSHPYSVVLLDEIEKAHPEVHQVFLQVFDDGRLTDSQGRRASFAEAIIIMTSNLGSSHIAGSGAMGFHAEAMAAGDSAERQRHRERIMEAVRAAMPPELLNRIQRLVFFNPLSREVVREIIDKILAGLKARLARRSVTLDLDDAAYDLLIAEGFDETYGARAMERTVERLISEPLSRLLLEGQAADGGRFFVYVHDGQVTFESR